ncbi:MAG: crossover junction endodeoxyribonuclease RuvC [Bdellovibrionales bacterium]
MIIIGIDPGSQRTGWGVISVRSSTSQFASNFDLKCLGFGVIDLTEKPTFQARLAKLHEELNSLIQKFEPQFMSVEKVFLGKNADSAFKLGHARGVVLAHAGAYNLSLSEYATRVVKKALTGSGAAEKEQVQFMVDSILKIKTNQLDASDALAAAICMAREIEVNQKLMAFQPSQLKIKQENNL